MKKLFSKLFSNVFVVLGVMALTPIVVFVSFVIYMRTTGGDPSWMISPNHATYANLFYNYKCLATKAMAPNEGETKQQAKKRLTAYTLSNIEEMNMSYAEALEVLEESRRQWYIGGMDHQVGAWKNCHKETIDYYNLIIPAVEEKARKEKTWRDRWKVWKLWGAWK